MNLKAGGGPQRPSFLCLPKEKKAKERAPCYRLIAARLADHGAKRTRRYAPQTPFRIIRDRLRCSLAIEGNPRGEHSGYEEKKPPNATYAQPSSAGQTGNKRPSV
jgi:hypothetical protein